MTITERIIPVNKYNRPSTKCAPKKICVHYTGNAGSSAASGAATADEYAEELAHRRYWRSEINRLEENN